MANGFNPYAAAAGQTDLLENLLKAADIERKADQSISKQKKEMTDKFEQDLTDAQLRQERELQKRKKKNPFATLLKGASMFLHGIGPAVVNSLLSMKELRDKSDFAKDTDFMSGKGTAAEMGSFADGGIATMFVERR